MDPASLEGLEPLLDRVFSADPTVRLERPDVRPFMSPVTRLPISTVDSGEILGADDDEIISSGSNRSTEAADASLVINELCATIDLLRAQLAFSNSELRFANDRNRWLEMQVATKDDQLRLMPDLMSRAAQVTVAEQELRDIQLEADRLLDETVEIRELTAQLSATLNESLKELEEINKPLWKKVWEFLLRPLWQ
jgi:chromosome segregation ATPase